jgi:hypothetical protein
VPFVLDVPHQERAIELNGTSWEPLYIIEETGTNGLNVERFDTPARGVKFKAVATVWIAGC